MDQETFDAMMAEWFKTNDPSPTGQEQLASSMQMNNQSGNLGMDIFNKTPNMQNYANYSGLFDSLPQARPAPQRAAPQPMGGQQMTYLQSLLY